MSASEKILFLGLPIVSFTIGYVLGALAGRRAWHIPRTQLLAIAICFLGPLAVFFALELQAALAADRGFAALQSAATTAVVLALACIPLAPIPAFIGVRLAVRVNAPPQDDVES
ncbi:MAG TPA: hypothetical protein VHD36_23150 [Pirellulales bacterium]|nr:hypothetical protein [Pirellulales bacterium]